LLPMTTSYGAAAATRILVGPVMGPPGLD
jgi:hypothetical protein